MTRKKVVSVCLNHEKITKADAVARRLSTIEGRPVSRSEVIQAAIDLIDETCPESEVDAEADRVRRAAMSGNAGVAMLRNRLRANVAQSVEQRFRNPLSPTRRSRPALQPAQLRLVA